MIRHRQIHKCVLKLGIKGTNVQAWKTIFLNWTLTPHLLFSPTHPTPPRNFLSPSLSNNFSWSTRRTSFVPLKTQATTGKKPPLDSRMLVFVPPHPSVFVDYVYS